MCHLADTHLAGTCLPALPQKPAVDSPTSGQEDAHQETSVPQAIGKAPFTFATLQCASAGAGLHQLSTLSRLQHLNLRGVYRLADTNLAVSGLTALQSLNLQECWQITAQGLMNLSTLVQLTHLNLQVRLSLPHDNESC